MNIIFFGDSLTEGIPGVSYYNILKEKLPQYNLVNCGKGGDTVISLLRRIKKMNISQTYDIAFLWIGANDVLVHASKKFPLIKLCCNQPWTKNTDDFKNHYQQLLETITGKAKMIFTVSPSIIGEDIHNKWNKKLDELSTEIEALSVRYENVEYIDLRKNFISTLSTKKTSSYILKSVIVDVIIAWLRNDLECVEKKSKKRGLYLTLDGVHLNSAGAQMVADMIRELISNSVQKKVKT